MLEYKYCFIYEFIYGCIILHGLCVYLTAYLIIKYDQCHRPLLYMYVYLAFVFSRNYQHKSLKQIIVKDIKCHGLMLSVVLLLWGNKFTFSYERYHFHSHRSSYEEVFFLAKGGVCRRRKL